MTEKEALQKQIATHQRRLNILKEKQARLGYSSPPEVITEIEDIEAQVAKLKAELEALGGVAETDLTQLPLREQQYQIALHWAEDGRQANLSRFDLSGRDLRTVDLVGAKLNVANLSGADLTMADLRKADLRMADLTKALLHKTNLSGVNMTGADQIGRAHV